MTDIATLTQLLIRFRDERNWKQFHTLKNLIISVNLEAAELLELMQWKTEAEIAELSADPAFQTNLQDECADILMYLLLIAEHANFDLAQAAQAKLGKNAVKYPVNQTYGRSAKYDQLAE